jgi:hypothetical protein
MPYKKCIDNRAWQDRMLNKTLKLGGFITLCAATVGVYHVVQSIGVDLSINGLINKLNF